MEFDSKNTVEKLLRSSPEMAADFAIGCQAVKSAIKASQADFLVLPERGSLPVFWTALGRSELSDFTQSAPLFPPIGSYCHAESPTQMTSLQKPQKQQLINNLVVGTDGAKYDLLDEVQHGGTIYTAANYIRQAISPKSRLNVFAAKDTRIVNGSMSVRYLDLEANQGQVKASTTVFPMPLIATDRDPLLNGLLRTDTRPHDSLDIEIQVVNNSFAERVFKAMGCVASNYRDTEALVGFHDLLSNGATDGSITSVIADWSKRFGLAVTQKSV